MLKTNAKTMGANTIGNRTKLPSCCILVVTARFCFLVILISQMVFQFDRITGNKTVLKIFIFSMA